MGFKRNNFDGPANRPEPQQPEDPCKIPRELRDLSQWVVWRLELSGGRMTKILYRSRSSRVKAKSNDASTWSIYDDAVAALGRDRTLAGLGFVVSEDDPYCGVDLDHCRDPETGDLAPWVFPIIQVIPSYAEVTPSKTGIRVWIKAKLADGCEHKKTGMGKDGSGSIEVYDRLRFFTVTGDAINGRKEIADHSEAFPAIYARWFPPKPKPEHPKPSIPASDSDAEMIRKLVSDRNGEKFRKLYHDGEIIDTDGGQNASDLALCSLIAFRAKGDHATVDRIFRTSALMRPKWDEMRGQKTYGQMTVERSCNRHAFHDSTYNSRPAPRAEQTPEVSDPGEPQAPQGVDDEPIEDDRPIIVVTTRENLVNDDAINALARNPDIYTRGKFLVVPYFEDAARSLKTRDPFPPVTLQIKKAGLRELLSKAARWVKVYYDEEKDMEVMKDVHVPEWAASQIIERPGWDQIRPIEAIIECPILLPSGKILQEAGYNAETGLLYRPDREYPGMMEDYSKDAVAAAVSTINNLVRDFPFMKMGSVDTDNNDGGKTHRAAYLAAVLTPLARPAIKGPCPLFFFGANIPASGKTILIKIASIISTGMDMHPMSYSENDEEMDKRITSAGLESQRMILLDNIKTGGVFGCKSLDLALTSTTYKGRMLGRSELVTTTMTAVWYASGNNVEFGGSNSDIISRIIPVYLESTEEHPEERDDFAIEGDIIDHVHKNRVQYLMAALTILGGYYAAGCPETKIVPTRFTAWDRVVRQAIIWATGVDPGASRKTIVAEDTETNWNQLLLAGWASLPRQSLSISQAYELLDKYKPSDGEPTLWPALRSVLAEWARDGVRPSPKSLGMRMGKIKGRVFGGKVLRSKSDSQHGQLWRVDDVEGSEITGTF